ncbi:MAG: hypothetical protein EDM74_01720 [Armatimonadetes bacterium]|nr:MAG: hypothetical protein EDM74_01720 [Armatimonadota bacterium]
MLALLLALTAQASDAPGFPWQTSPVQTYDANAIDRSVDAILIVRGSERIGAQRRVLEPNLFGFEGVSLILDDVSVVDSTAPVERKLRLLHHYGRTDYVGTEPARDMYALRQGRTYLVLVKFGSKDRLYLPESQGPAAAGDSKERFLSFARERDDEVVALAAFATSQTKVQAVDLSMLDRVMVNVAHCSDTSDTGELCRSLNFLYWLKLGTFEYKETSPVAGSWNRLALVPDEHVAVQVLETALRRQAASNAARILSLFVHWNLKGAGRRLYEALQVAAFDRELGALPNDAFLSDVRLGPDAVLSGGETSAERQAKLESAVDLALRSKSVAAARLLIDNAAPLPDVRLQTRVFQRALTAEQELSKLLFHYLSRCAKDKDLEPRMSRVGKTLQWVNRQQLIDFWKERLGLPPLIAAHAQQGS